jgi:hypothetical protein
MEKMNKEKISKKDFEIIFSIEFILFNNPKQLSQQLSITEIEAEKKLLEFEAEGLIKIENREGKIYGSQLTKKGLAIFNDPKYEKWKKELEELED